VRPALGVVDALVSLSDFQRAQEPRASRARGNYTKKGNPTRRPYVFRGCILCGYCSRKMRGNWNNQQAYYRCRFPEEYALVNELDHPRSSTYAKRRSSNPSTTGSPPRSH
jgi:hypothetical protein